MHLFLEYAPVDVLQLQRLDLAAKVDRVLVGEHAVGGACCVSADAKPRNGNLGADRQRPVAALRHPCHAVLELLGVERLVLVRRAVRKESQPNEGLVLAEVEQPIKLAPHGIRVNAIAPGATATPIFWSGSPGSERGKKLSQEDNDVRQAKVEANIVNNVSPLRIGRSGTGMDIAQTAVFLASDESEWTTAQVFIVDGGITTFDAPNKGWMADVPMVDPVPLRNVTKPKL